VSNTTVLKPVDGGANASYTVIEFIAEVPHTTLDSCLSVILYCPPAPAEDAETPILMFTMQFKMSR
jgi:hypothetical protein